MKDYGMSEYKNPKAVQAKLDQDAKALRKMIDYYGGLADSLCEADEAAQSSLVRDAVADLNRALSKGRLISLQIDGVQVAPLGGGK
jgi:hypothetical protein